MKVKELAFLIINIIRLYCNVWQYIPSVHKTLVMGIPDDAIIYLLLPLICHLSFTAFKVVQNILLMYIRCNM